MYGLHFVFMSPILSPCQSVDRFLKLFEGAPNDWCKYTKAYGEHYKMMKTKYETLWDNTEKFTLGAAIEKPKVIRIANKRKFKRPRKIQKKKAGISPQREAQSSAQMQSDEEKKSSADNDEDPCDLTEFPDWYAYTLGYFEQAGVEQDEYGMIPDLFRANVRIYEEHGLWGKVFSGGNAVDLGQMHLVLLGDTEYTMLGSAIFKDQFDAIEKFRKGDVLRKCEFQYKLFGHVPVLMIHSFVAVENEQFLENNALQSIYNSRAINEVLQAAIPESQ